MCLIDFFFETILLCSSGWPQLYNCHASISQGWDHRCEPWAIHSMFPMVQVKKKKKTKTLSFQIHIKKSSPWEVYPWHEFSLWLPPFPLGWLTVISLSDCDDGFQLTSLSSPLWLHSFTYGPLCCSDSLLFLMSQAWFTLDFHSSCAL